MFLFMNFALKEHPLASCQLRQSKLFLPYQQHTALLIHSLKSFLANKSGPKVGKLTLSVQHATDPVSHSLSQVFAPRPILVFGALVQHESNNGGSNFCKTMPIIPTNSTTFECVTYAREYSLITISYG
jgi:hypothetical protein